MGSAESVIAAAHKGRGRQLIASQVVVGGSGTTAIRLANQHRRLFAAKRRQQAEMSYVGQDMPPPGPHPAVPYARHIPRRGPSGAVLLGGVVGIVSFGYYMHYRGLLVQQELLREKLQARLHLLPLLQYEQDCQLVESLQRQREEESELLGRKLGKGDLSSPHYHNKRALVAASYRS